MIGLTDLKSQALIKNPAKPHREWKNPAYLPAKVELISPFNYDGETYSLKDHSAQDTGRYDFCRDLERLENMVDLGVAAHGYAIFLSNEPQYWKEGRKLAPCDQSFRLHQGVRDFRSPIRQQGALNPMGQSFDY